jgi:hypothetical protein
MPGSPADLALILLNCYKVGIGPETGFRQALLGAGKSQELSETSSSIPSAQIKLPVIAATGLATRPNERESHVAESKSCIYKPTAVSCSFHCGTMMGRSNKLLLFRCWETRDRKSNGPRQILQLFLQVDLLI